MFLAVLYVMIIYSHIECKINEERTFNAFITEPFLLDTLKTIFWMENLTERRTLSGPFFQNRGTFLIFKKGQGRPPSSPLPLLRTWKVVYKKKLLLKLCNIHRKTTVLEALGLQLYYETPQHRCFPVNIAKILKTPFLHSSSGDCLWKLDLKTFPGGDYLFFARRIWKQLLWKPFVMTAIS